MGKDADAIKRRSNEIQQIKKLLEFDHVYELDYATTRLDQIEFSSLVIEISKVFESYRPDEIFVPHPSDVHTDHQVVFDAVASSAKWFRQPSISRVLAYETLSETEFNLHPFNKFSPNYFIDIAPYLDKKVRALNIYSSELGTFPFPRSEKAVRALAMVRGSASGFEAAEAFQLLLERN